MASTVRLTRRGRMVLKAGAMVLIALLTLVITVLLTRLAHAAPPTPSADDRQVHRVLVVQPVDTLWQIALRLAPQTDPRVTIARILAVNPSARAVIQPGQQLVVP